MTDSMSEGGGSSASSGAPRPLRALLQALYAVALIALASAALKGWRDHQHAVEHERTLEAEIAATEERIATLKLRIDRLQHDPATLDRVAREELGLVKPNEVVIVLPERPSSAPLPALPPSLPPPPTPPTP